MKFLFLLLLGPGGTPPDPPLEFLVGRPGPTGHGCGARSTGRWQPGRRPQERKALVAGSTTQASFCGGGMRVGAEPRSPNPKKVRSQLEPPCQGLFSGVFLSENG